MAKAQLNSSGSSLVCSLSCDTKRFVHRDITKLVSKIGMFNWLIRFTNRSCNVTIESVPLIRIPQMFTYYFEDIDGRNGSIVPSSSLQAILLEVVAALQRLLPAESGIQYE